MAAPGAGEVHVWSLVLPQAAGISADLAHLLSADEHERAQRFHVARARDCFIACRGVLRLLLGTYLQRGPATLRFVYGVHGKPALDGDAQDLRFNLSHAGDLAVFAVARGLDLGVDVEPLQPVPHARAAASRLMRADDAAQLDAAPADQRDGRFLELWTRHEARLKADGRGLGGGDAAAHWRVHTFTPAPGHIGALAVGGPFRLHCGTLQVVSSQRPRYRRRYADGETPWRSRNSAEKCVGDLKP